MGKLEDIVRNFCIANIDRQEINFNAFKNPEDLYKQFGNNLTLNQFKGNILEILLEELFLGNGYKVERLGEGGKDAGCDLLIRYPQNDSVRFVLQAKNWNKHIDKYDVKKEYAKFADNYRKKYNLNSTNFCFVAWHFVKDVKNQLKSELNIKAWEEQDIVYKLFQNYKPVHPHYPCLILEPYQEKAYENVLKFWNEDKRCYIEHATGTGKTYVVARIVQDLLKNPQNRILILSPSIYINDRIYALLERIVSSKHIAKSLQKKKPISLLTYPYLMFNAAKMQLGSSFTHIIMDEAHRAGAPKWHGEGLLNFINKGTKILGLSATMQRYSGGIDIKSFLENNCAGRLSLFEAMAKGILPVGRYVYSVVNMKSKIKDLKNEITKKYDRTPSKREKLLVKLNAREIKDYSIQKIIYKHYHSGAYRKIIAFCEDIEHNYDIQSLLIKVFRKYSKIKRFEVHSESSRKENLEQLDKFSNTTPKLNETYILTAVDMLNEGIDVTGIDSVMLFRRTESPRIYLQQIGRCIRKHGVDNPLIFDCVLNYRNVDIHFVKESQKAIDSFEKALVAFDLEEIEKPKTIQVYDETLDISAIIKEVEERLNLYPTYIEAKKAVQALGIQSYIEYQRQKRYKDDPRLPATPDRVYKDSGWIDWDDFLGKESRPQFYVHYEKAKKAVQALGIQSYTEYQKHKRYKEDPRLPNDPERVYKNRGWIDWFDFLGKEPPPDFYPTYGEAKKAVKKLGIQSDTEYQKHKRYKEDPRLTSIPDRVYKGRGWIDWFDFLGKISHPEPYSTYEEAKKAVQRLGIQSHTEYRKHKRYKEDLRLRPLPEQTYKDRGWIDWDNFLGKTSRPAFYPTYERAKKAVQALGIQSYDEYHSRYKEDPQLPSVPNQIYKEKGWIDWLDFLGKEAHDLYPTYKEAKKAVQALSIQSASEYRTRHKEDPRLSWVPDQIYKEKGWINWLDFLGKVSPPQPYSNYEEAKKAAQKLGIQSMSEYKMRYQEDQRLPSKPYRTYIDRGWIDWDDFFGKESRPDFYPTYEEAKKAVQSLIINSQTEYHRRHKENARLPYDPKRVYKGRGWIDWFDFLGKASPLSPYPTYEAAKKAVQALGIQTASEYRKRYKEDPKLISNPYNIYKDKDWVDWFDFLGKKKLIE